MLNPPQKTIWQKLSVYVEVIIYLVIIAIAIKLYLPEHKRAQEMTAELQRLEQVRAAKQQAVDQIKREHENLKTDTKYLEVIARDRLDLQRDNEYIVQFKEEPTESE